ncbi:MAG: hypothetical protein GYA51_08845 [Candidatus Methanofastidiosa archaeon]|jgi:hypothetical protein|nr:hypothetical protein [Candidatus Methanofastidiosa archaeon]
MQKEVYVVATFVLAIGLAVAVYNIFLLDRQNESLTMRLNEVNTELTKLQGQQKILENKVLVLESEKSQYDSIVRNYTLQIQDLLKKNEVLALQLNSWDIPVIWVSTIVEWTSSTTHPSDNVKIVFNLTNTSNDSAQNIRISLPDSYMRGFQVISVSNPRARLISNEISIDSLGPRETLIFEVILRTQSPGLYTGPLRIRWTGLGDYFILTDLNTRVI